MEERKNIYFVSDSHFGVPDYESSLKREKLFVRWLEDIKNDAKEIFFMGDIFDFWFEYKTVVPKGYVRLLGKLAEITDLGIPVYYFKGNHDMWMFDYFPKELNIPLYREPMIKTYYGKKFYIAHGDGIGPGDSGYKFIRRVFSNKICQWLFARIHPNFALRMALFLSRKSRYSRGADDDFFHGEGTPKERLITFAKEKLKEEHFDYFIFGHRHLPIDLMIGDNTRYINIGDWISHFSYVVFDGEKLELKKYKPE